MSFKIHKKITLKRVFSFFLLVLFLLNSLPLSLKAQEGYGNCNSSDSDFSQLASLNYLNNLSEKELLRILNEAEAICNILSLTNGKLHPYFNRGAKEYPSSSYICGLAEEVKKRNWLRQEVGIKDDMKPEAISFIRNVFTLAPAAISQLGCPDPSSNSQLIEKANLGSKSISALKALCQYCETLNPQQIQNIASDIRGKIIFSEWWQATKEVTVETTKDVAAYIQNITKKIKEEECINLSGWKIAKDLITFSFFQFIEDVVFIPIIGMLRLVLKWIIQVWVWFLTPTNFGGYINFPPVKILWTYILNLSYIGIILSFLFMAIAQILGLKEYGWEKILWRIIIVALLVNFSLVICGIFVDLSNFFTSYFVSMPPIYGESPMASAGLELKIPHIITKIACHFSGSQGTFVYTAGLFLSLILVIIFIGQFVGILFYTVIRVVTLWITIILSPLAAVAFILPAFKKGWEAWRNYFTQAIISLPVIAFCLWLTIGMLDAFIDGLNQLQTGLTGELTFIPALAHAILLGILAQSTLAVAGALGVNQINQGYKLATKLIWSGLGAVGGYALGKTTKGLTSSASWKATAENLEKSNIAPLHNLGIQMKQITQRTRSGEIKQAEERAATMSEEELRREGEYFVKHHDFYRAKVFYDELAKKQKIDTKKDKENISILKDYINPALLKKANPILFLENFGKKEEIDEIRNKAKQIAQGDEVKERMEYQRMLTEKFISEAEEKDLSDTPWEKVLEFNPYSDKELATFTETQRQAIEARVPGLQQEARTKLFADLAVNKEVTADGLANIYRKFDSGKIMQHTNELLEGIKQTLQGKTQKTAREYLTEDLGYQYNLYWQNILKRATKTSGGSTPTPPPPSTTQSPPTQSPPGTPPPPRPSGMSPSWKWHPLPGEGKGFWEPKE